MTSDAASGNSEDRTFENRSSAVRILVLEDDTDMRELLVEVLSDRGFEVVPSAGSEEALALSRSETFDLIIADIRMEGLSGLDTIERAKQHHPDLGSIVISGYASEEETLRAVKLNVGGYLKKPFKMQELLNQINKFVAQKSLAEKRRKNQQALHQALLWSLDTLGQLGEKSHPGKVLKSADLAVGVADHLGVASKSQEELRAATILHQLRALENLDFPPELGRWVESLPTLQHALDNADENTEVSAFAARICRDASPWEELDPRLLTAYQSWSQGEQPAPKPSTDKVSLLRLARTLEQTRKLEQASKVYRELLGEQSSHSSRDAISAHLGLARVAFQQSDRPNLEKQVQQALLQAERHGPVTLAQTQLAGASILARAEHPATEKLLVRACATLESVQLEVDHARATVRLATLSSNLPPERLQRALRTLANPAHLSEVFEHLGQLLLDLLRLSLSCQDELCQRLTARLVTDHPQEVSALLRQQALPRPLRERVLEILEAQGQDVAPELLRVLSEDGEPEIRTRALNLKAGSQAPPVLRVHSLGTEEVFLAEHEFQESDWKSAKVKHVFLYLISQHNSSGLVDLILEEFWPGPVEAARNNLNAAVSSIRKTLRQAEVEVEAKWDPVPREHDRLSLNPKIVLWHDLSELKKAYRAGSAAKMNNRPGEAVAHFRRVAQLYRGPFLEGCYMEWALQIRESITNWATEALQSVVSHCLVTESYKEALEYSVRLIQCSPDSQEAHHAKMQAHLGLGQPEAVMKQYESCAKMLEVEYGVEPNTELLKTYHQAKYGLGQSSSNFLG